VEAWVRLHQKYSQRTMARMYAGGDRVYVPKGSEIGDLNRAIMEWEANGRQC